MDESNIGLRITGIKPEDIRAGELANILKSFEDLIASDIKRHKPQIAKEQLGIGLVKLFDQSIGLEFSTKLPELTIPSFESIARIIEKETYLDLSTETLKHLKEIISFLKLKNCEGEMFIQNGKTDLKAILLPSMVVPEHPILLAKTIVFGRVVRVGGAEPRVMFESSPGKTLYCRVSDEELARKLGERLYTWVGLKGLASLDSDSLEIIEFKVDGMTNFEDSLSITESFRELGKIAGKYYADIQDVEGYIEEMRL